MLVCAHGYNSSMATIRWLWSQRNVKAAHSLIDSNVAWCTWSGMEIRTDKCIAFMMRKQDGVDFDMKYESVKSNLHSKLSDMHTEKINRPATEIRKLKFFIPSQLSFILKIYDIPYTWNNSPESLIWKSVTTWLDLSISFCNKEILELSRRKEDIEYL